MPGSQGEQKATKGTKAESSMVKRFMMGKAGSMNRIGDYNLIERIGAGGMGEVWRAENVHTRVPCAVKLLPADATADKNFVARFFDEGRVMQTLEHPNIVRVHHVGHDEKSGRYFLVEDLIETKAETGNLKPESVSLHDLLQDAPDNRLPEKDVRKWAIQVAEALAYAHEKGVIHRDIKPANVLIDADGNAKVTDFGLAKAIGEEYVQSQIHVSIAQSMGAQKTTRDRMAKSLGDEKTIDSDHPSNPSTGSGRAGRTTADALLGTYDYMSPEQRGELPGVEVGPASDVFAFGVMLYRMLTGVRPIGRAKAVSVLRPGISKQWDFLIDRCLEIRPADRYPNGAELLKALGNADVQGCSKLLISLCAIVLFLVAGLLAHQYLYEPLALSRRVAQGHNVQEATGQEQLIQMAREEQSKAVALAKQKEEEQHQREGALRKELAKAEEDARRAQAEAKRLTELEAESAREGDEATEAAEADRLRAEEESDRTAALETARLKKAREEEMEAELLAKHGRDLVTPTSVIGFHRRSLELGSPFCDYAVFQRDKPVPVWGWSRPQSEVSVEFAGQKKTVRSDNSGKWTATLDPMPANARSQDMQVTDSGERDAVIVKSIMVGDVILFARQASCDISLGRDDEGRRVASTKLNNDCRVMQIRAIPSMRPRGKIAAEATDGWAVVERKNALTMSAAAYYLILKLDSFSDVPIGVIDLNLGSAFPVSWLSRESLEQTEERFGASDVPGQLSRFDSCVAAAEGNGVLPRGMQTNFLEHPLFPSGAYNGTLYPLGRLPLKAALVQIGGDYPYMAYAALDKMGKQTDRAALNQAYVDTYDIIKVGFRMDSVTLPRIPAELRHLFGHASLPVALIAPPSSDLDTLAIHHREMRELQRVTAERDEYTDVILPGMENIPFSAQPRDEALLAERCAKWLMSSVYGDHSAPATGPVFDRLESSGKEATVFFKPGTADGLRWTGKALDYFEASESTGGYSRVRASVEGSTIRLKSDELERIANVRYNWCEAPDQGLVNSAGLPAMPFRTEEQAYKWFVHGDRYNYVASGEYDAWNLTGGGPSEESSQNKRVWRSLTTRYAATANDKTNFGAVASSEATKWRMSVYESMTQLPVGWEQPKFDDSSWTETILPVSWRMDHIAVFRTVFDIEDLKAFDSLALRAWIFRQSDLQIFLNGDLIGEIRAVARNTGTIESGFSESALKSLKSGTNVLVIKTRHNWRWGMLSMRVYNDGFDFVLGGRVKGNL